MNTIGIDALHLSCLTIKHIDWDVLKENPKASRRSEGWNMQYAWESISKGDSEIYQHCTCVMINDNERFYNCVIGVKIVHGNPILYAKIQLTVHHILGHNNTNMTWDRYNIYVQKLFSQYIPEQYGVYLSLDNATISYMEINLDILLSYSYDQYERVFRLFMLQLGKRYPGIWEHRNAKDNKSESMKCENKSIAISIYNKTREAVGWKDPNAEHLLRIEFRLKTADKVQDVFQSRKWSEITQRDIVNAYHMLFTKKFRNTHTIWLQWTQTDLRRRLNRYHIQKNGKWVWARQWARDLREELLADEIRMNQIVVLDIEQVDEALKSMPDVHRNVGKKMVALRKHWGDTRDHVFFHHDLLKVQEVFDKEYDAYTKSDE